LMAMSERDLQRIRKVLSRVVDGADIDTFG